MTTVLWMVYVFGVGFFVGQLRHMKDRTRWSIATGLVLGLTWPVTLTIATAVRITTPPKGVRRG